MKSAITMSADGVRAKLDEFGVPQRAILLLPDATYSFPTLRWVTKNLSVVLAPYLADKVGSYEIDAADCDDFTNEASTYVHRAHRKTIERPHECAIAWGRWWYVRHDGIAHSINAFMATENEQWRLFHFEPQICQVITLTTEEFQSCALCAFL